jgi:hypothetical protein
MYGVQMLLLLLRLCPLLRLGNELLEQVGSPSSLTQTLERARKTDKFSRRSSRADAVELTAKEHFLPFSREPACALLKKMAPGVVHCLVV